jgi:hypothetical protein
MKMTVALCTSTQRFIGKSWDDKPTAPPAGSTFLELDTGRELIFDGTVWQQDLRMSYALQEVLVKGQ